MSDCKIMLGRKAVHHSPTVLTAIPSPKAPTVPRVALPRSVPTPSRTRFRPSGTSMSAGKIGTAIRD